MARKPRGYWQKPASDLAITHDPSDANTSRGYIGVKRNGGYKLLHDFIWEELVGPIPHGHVIDHINGIKTDCELLNLRCVTQKVNTRNSSMRSDNVSGVTGVCLRTFKGFSYWTATIKDPLTGKTVTKSFSVGKLGDAVAFDKAKAWRAMQLQHLINNHDYTTTHGV